MANLIGRDRLDFIYHFQKYYDPPKNIMILLMKLHSQNGEVVS